ncbi:MAG: DUF3048 domain-containing protein [Anaerolineales bacterium]|nr:DUF3048 domain-containing protein [Anaerolineales bacterium]
MNRKIHLTAFLILVLIGGIAWGSPGLASSAQSLVAGTTTLVLSATPSLQNIALTATAEMASKTPRTPTPSVSPAPPTQTPYPVIIPLIIHQPTPVGYGPEEYEIGINPLTGLQVDDLARLERRPLAIKVTNYPRYVRPQYGLSRADIVFEYYMESGIARFIGVFYGQDAAKVGPVRSGRFFDENVARMYDAIFVFGSADKRVLNYFLQMDNHFKNSLLIESEEDRKNDCNLVSGVPLCRDKSLETYNNLFANTSAISEYVTWKGTDNDKPDLTGMRFTYRTPFGGDLALNIVTRFSLFIYNKWAYSLEAGKYLRYQETIGNADSNFESFEPHYDALTGEQLSADNVVVVVVDYDFFVKTDTTEMMDVNFFGRGQAYVFRDGYMFPAEWRREQANGVLQLYDLDGEPFPLKPGQTWIEVMSEEYEYHHSGVDYRFTFKLPSLPIQPLNPTAKPIISPTPDYDKLPIDQLDEIPTPVIIKKDD